MKKQTLKELIEIEFDRCETIFHFKKEVFRLIDLYDGDGNNVEKILNVLGDTKIGVHFTEDIQGKDWTIGILK